MSVIEQELTELKSKVPKIVDVELNACVPAIVNVKITKTEYKQLSISFQFPADYPNDPIVIELNSKVLSYRLLDGLSKVAEQEAKKYVGQPHVIIMVKFINKFIDENPLCVCVDEIHYIKRDLVTENDKIILKQKTSQVIAKLKMKEYSCTVKATVPNMYPAEAVDVDISDINLPDVLSINMKAQAVEIARKCVQPPLVKNPKATPFMAKPSLRPVLEFLMKEAMQRIPHEICPCCRKDALPPDPKDVCNEEGSGMFVERMYCGHLFHHGCLAAYMKIPPFTGGKKCPKCEKRIFHEKFKITPELAEARWSHKQAKQRELSEVVDFFE